MDEVNFKSQIDDLNNRDAAQELRLCLISEDDEKSKRYEDDHEIEMTSLDTENETRRKPVIPTSDVHYKVEDIPPWYLALILGLQHYLTMVGGTVSYPYVLTPKLCIRDNDPARGYIISTTFFASGLVTFIQATFGVRLPIIQGSSFAFLIPTLAILNLPQWQCPSEAEIIAVRAMNSSEGAVTDDEWQDVWQSRMREIQGAVIVSSIIEVVIGFTGIIGFLLRWITPISITPIIALIGLSLYEEASNAASKHWGIALLTSGLLIIFSQYLTNVDVPLLTFSKAKRKFQKTKFPLFKLFPVLLTIIVSWLFCVILTASNVFEVGHPARTDTRMSALTNSAWFRFPYPGQWGLPTVSAGAVFGMMAGVISSAMESVGDYYACARMAGAPPPPTHAVNRGIFMEGIGCILSGIWGTGNGLTSYSENIGAIGVTKVGSRRVVQFGAGLMVLFGLVGKFGSIFITIPEPILGGLFFVMFSVIIGVALNNLQFINLNSSRNLFILGISIFSGLCIPKWMRANSDAIHTGYNFADQIFLILISTSLFVGGVVAVFLDNTIPGTSDERGTHKWRAHASSDGSETTDEDKDLQMKCYDLPFGSDFIKTHRICRYIPISPTFRIAEHSVQKPIDL